MGFNLNPYLIIAATFLLSTLLTPVVRMVAIKRGWLAIPKKDRWHKKATALMGGIAIFLAASIPLLLIADFLPFVELLKSGQFRDTLVLFNAVLFIGICLMFALGLFDDLKNIRPQTKLIGQIVVAALVTFAGYRLHWFTSLTLDTMLTLFWIVGITNAFNLLDNMDGLCAGIGLVSSAFLAVLFYGQSPIPFLAALILAGALAGFLIYNFNPASIFMGDCGSLVIGFSIAMLSLGYSETDPGTRLAAIVVPILLLMVPIFDTSLVTIIRILSGRRASMGGRDHTSHRLVLIGLSERRAVVLLYAIGAVSGLSAVFVSRSDTLTSPVVIIPVILSFLMMAAYLAQLRVYPEKEFSMLRERVFTPVLMDLTYKRQILLVLLDFCLVAFSYYLAYRLRFDSKAFEYYFKVFLNSLPAVIACKFAVFFVLGLYKGIWDYFSTNEVYLNIKASLVATILAITVSTMVYRFEDFSKGVFAIDFFLTTTFLLGVRGSFRILHDRIKRKTRKGEKVLIYGAGRGGELLLREILNNDGLNVRPVGFLDDDELKQGKKLQGYPVLGAFEDLDVIRKRHGIKGLIISFHNHGDKHQQKRIYAFCLQKGLFVKQFSIRVEDLDF
jgi:UDP-GlcNAc:undecaprenyl-phosphate GlcNAc-1-phosphate transferase